MRLVYLYSVNLHNCITLHLKCTLYYTILFKVSFILRFLLVIHGVYLFSSFILPLVMMDESIIHYFSYGNEFGRSNSNFCRRELFLSGLCWYRSSEFVGIILIKQGNKAKTEPVTHKDSMKQKKEAIRVINKWVHKTSMECVN